MAKLNGTAKSEAINVTDNDAIISGNVPNFGGTEVGYQLVPKRKSLILTTLKIGKPSLKRNIMIKNKNETDIKPTTAKIYLTILSLMLWILRADCKVPFNIVFFNH